jgi:hypothetical protein
MIFFYIALLHCSIIDIDSFQTPVSGLYEETILFRSVKDLLNQKNKFISKKQLQDLFENENNPERKINFIFESLNRAYIIVTKQDFRPLRDLMLGLYNQKEIFYLTDYKNATMSNLITRLTELSCYDTLFSDSKYDSTSFENIFHFLANLRYKIDDKISGEHKPFIKKLLKDGKVIDKILFIEVLILSKMCDNFHSNFARENINNIYHHCPFLHYIWDDFGFDNLVEDDAYLLMYRSYFSSMKISTSILSSAYQSSYKKEVLTKITPSLFCSHGLTKFESEKILQKLLNEVIYLENDYVDMLLGQIYYCCMLLKKKS